MAAFQELVGKTIVGWKLDEGTRFSRKLTVRVSPHDDNLTITQNFHYETEGDCCAECWFESIEGEPGGVVVEVEEKGWQLHAGSYDECNVTETGFWTIKTTRGYIDVETRLSHNGYYGGWINFTGRSD